VDLLTEREEHWVSSYWFCYAGEDAPLADEALGKGRNWGMDGTNPHSYVTTTDTLGRLPYVEELDKSSCLVAQDTLYIGAGKDILFVGPPAGVLNHTMFAVELVEISGTAGTSTTPASYTYDVFLLGNTDTPLLSGAEPKQPRRNGAMVSGDGEIGTAYRDADGVFQLYDPAEVAETGACTD